MIQPPTGEVPEPARAAISGFLDIHPALTAEDKANMIKWTKSVPNTVSLKEWHTLTVRTQNDLVETSIDGKVVSSFQSPGVAHDHKSVVSLTTNRVDVIYDDFRIKGVAK